MDESDDDGDVTLRQALRIHLAENGFPPRRGHEQEVVTSYRLGQMPV